MNTIFQTKTKLTMNNVAPKFYDKRMIDVRFHEIKLIEVMHTHLLNLQRYHLIANRILYLMIQPGLRY